MAKAYANRVWMTTATTGTGTITLGSAKDGYLTFAEAGVANADTVTYCIIDGNDFEIGTGTYTSSGTTLSRDTVTVSKIGGTAGTSKINLSGSAEVFVCTDANDVVTYDANNRVGIGATSPSYKLVVEEASGHAKAQVVSQGTTAGWDDSAAFNVSVAGANAGAMELIVYGSGIGYLLSTAPSSTAIGTTSNTPVSFITNNVARLDVSTSGTITIKQSDDGAAANPILDIFRDSASPAASDVIGQVKFSGRDSAANAQDYATIHGVITDPTSTTEDGDIVFQTVVAGTMAERARLSGGNLTLTGNAIYYQAEQAEVGTTYTLALTDANKMVTLSNGSAITLTVPTNASVAFPIGTRIDISQFGAGQVSVSSSATIRSEGGKLKLRGQYSAATLWKKGTDEWLLAGDIVA